MDKNNNMQNYSPTSPSSDGFYSGYGRPELPPTPIEKKRGICCGIFDTRKKRWIWGGTLAVGAVFLALLVFFLYPRSPTIWLVPPPNSPALTKIAFETQNNSNIAIASLNVSPERPLNVRMDLNLLAIVFSPNYIDINAKKVYLEFNMVDKKGTVLSNVKGNATLYDQIIYKRQNSTLNSTGTLTYSLTTPLINASSDPMFSILIENCLQQQGTITLRYKLWIEINGLAGIKPEFSGDIVSKCPINSREFFRELASPLAGGITNVFQDIFRPFTDAIGNIAGK